MSELERRTWVVISGETFWAKLRGSGRSSCSLNPESSVRDEAGGVCVFAGGCAEGCMGLVTIAGGFEASWGKTAFFQLDCTTDGTGGAGAAFPASHPAGPHVSSARTGDAMQTKAIRLTDSSPIFICSCLLWRFREARLELSA